MNTALKAHIEKGASMKQIQDTFDGLQFCCAQYINSDLPGFPQTFLDPVNKCVDNVAFCSVIIVRFILEKNPFYSSVVEPTTAAKKRMDTT